MSDKANLSDVFSARQARRFAALNIARSAVLRYPAAMLDRADSQAIPAIAPLPTAALPAWARAKKPPETEAEAAFLAGAALARLDVLVRENPPWAGAWRQRLALAAAAASVGHAGRGEDFSALRDAFHLSRSAGRQSVTGGDPGPAGRRLLARRALARPSGQWRAAVATAAEALQWASDPGLPAAIAAAAACADGRRAAPFATARAHQLALHALAPATGRAGGGEGALIAAWLADAALARKLNWPFALPLLAASLPSPGRRVAEPAGEGADAGPILFAYARAATRAHDLAAELARAARRLEQAAPKLRAKGAAAALQGLLEEDSLSAATKLPGLSERGARRLFERLVALQAVRELTGRPTFRLYGL